MTIETPEQIITALLSVQNGGWAPCFGNPNTTFMRSYFTEGFNNDWAAAMRFNNVTPVFNGDPISGYAEVTALSLVTTIPLTQDAATASVNCMIKVTFGESTLPVTQLVTFSMQMETGVWKIDDINSHIVSYDRYGNRYVHPSLRMHFQSIITTYTKLYTTNVVLN